MMKRTSIAWFLAAFSIGLGVVELASPGTLAKFLGTRRRGVLRAFGVREIAAGLGIFARPSRPEPMWSRVAGDVVDLGALASCAMNGRKKKNAALAIGSVAAVTALDVLAARARA